MIVGDVQRFSSHVRQVAKRKDLPERPSGLPDRPSLSPRPSGAPSRPAGLPVRPESLPSRPSSFDSGSDQGEDHLETSTSAPTATDQEDQRAFSPLSTSSTERLHQPHAAVPPEHEDYPTHGWAASDEEDDDESDESDSITIFDRPGALPHRPTGAIPSRPHHLPSHPFEIPSRRPGTSRPTEPTSNSISSTPIHPSKGWTLPSMSSSSPDYGSEEGDDEGEGNDDYKQEEDDDDKEEGHDGDDDDDNDEEGEEDDRVVPTTINPAGSRPARRESTSGAWWMYVFSFSLPFLLLFAHTMSVENAPTYELI